MRAWRRPVSGWRRVIAVCQAGNVVAGSDCGDPSRSSTNTLSVARISPPYSRTRSASAVSSSAVAAASRSTSISADSPAKNGMSKVAPGAYTFSQRSISSAESEGLCPGLANTAVCGCLTASGNTAARSASRAGKRRYQPLAGTPPPRPPAAPARGRRCRGPWLATAAPGARPPAPAPAPALPR